MEELLKPALDAAFVKLDKVVSQTKNSFKYVDISDVNILQFQEFLTDNNIPDTAWFSTCGEDGPFEVNTPCLVYDVTVNKTKAEILRDRKARFTNVVWAMLYPLLTEKGYIRHFDSSLLREFKDTAIYDMYVNGEFDRLVKYYSLRFKKP